jgi:hypothetical protein
MNNLEIMQKADKALKELEQDINTYHPIAWSIPWEVDAIEKMEGIIAFYEKRKGEWLRMLSGASEIARNILIEFMKLADLEIEGAESVLFMIQGGKKREAEG